MFLLKKFAIGFLVGAAAVTATMLLATAGTALFGWSANLAQGLSGAAVGSLIGGYIGSRF